MINAPEARALILSSVAPLGTVTQSAERALGMFLAEEVVAGESIPAFDNSAVDGFAVRSEDLRELPRHLSLAGEIAAGSLPAGPVGKGEAMSIMTGAKIPEGCDAVVPVEWTEFPDEKRVTILKPAGPGLNIRNAGADLRRGATALLRHQLLRPQEIGLLASMGRRFVEVYRRPAVAILATGNELVEVAAPLSEGKVRNSNAVALSALVRESGGEPVRLGIAADERGDLKEKLARGLAADIFITTGGVSVGKYDLVREALQELGVGIKFWKVNIKPGMPLMFGLRGATPVFGLPGNPVSTMVTFLQFVRPALRRMMGAEEPEPPVRVSARLEQAVQKSDGKRHFVRGIVEERGGSLVVRPTGPQTSNMLSSLTRANCLIVLPEEMTQAGAGDMVEVQLL